MEYHKIKSPKTNRPIYIYGDAYNQLIKNGYTEDYLLSLPKINVTKPLSIKDPFSTGPKHTKSANKNKNNEEQSFTADMLFQIALNLNYFNIIDLCHVNKNYSQLCSNQHFWKEKYNQDFSQFNKEAYIKQADYYKKWFPSKLKTFEEYNRKKFLKSSENWKTLYEHDYYNKIENLANSIFYRFGVQEKYDNHYHDRKDKIVKTIINYKKSRINLTDITMIDQLNNRIVSDIKKLLAYHYKDFNYYAKFFGDKPADNDTPEEFILKIVQKEL